MEPMNYISFFVSFIAVAVIMPFLIPMLRRMKFGQVIRDEGPAWHAKKNGTPTMGGIAFLLVSVIVSLIVCPDIKLKAGIIAAALYGVVGFIDDFIKIKLKRNLGLTAKQKLILQILISVSFGLFVTSSGYTDTTLSIPFTQVVFDLGWAYIPFITVFMVGVTNAVNLTDGLDGLATSVTVVVCAFFTFSSIMMRELTNSYFACALAGGLAGFLIYNFYPAKVFMGDTGSLFLGGAVSVMAINLKLELLLILVGFIYVIEALSVIIQVISFKTTGKRVFLMSPIHHHYEKKGMSEIKIVYAFSAVTLIMCIVSAVSVII